jgi:plastocyanin
MRYFLSLLAVLAMVGAGCTATTNIEPTTDDTTDLTGGVEDLGDALVDVGDAVIDAVVVPVDSDPIEVVVDTGDTGSETVDTDDGGVPIIDIVLGAAPDQSIDMVTGNFFFSPNVITASPGDRIKISFTENTGFHTFVIDEIGADFSIAEGESYVFSAPDKPGDYAFYCDIGSHRAQGMEGVLTITE